MNMSNDVCWKSFALVSFNCKEFSARWFRQSLGLKTLEAERKKAKAKMMYKLLNIYLFIYLLTLHSND